MPKGEDFLGSKQWKDLKIAINEKFTKTDVIIVASTLPIVFMSRVFTNIAAYKVDDLEGMWGYKSELEQYNFLKLL